MPLLTTRTALNLAALAGTILAMAACPRVMAGDCPGTWSDQFAFAGSNAQISDTAIWDDGTGPALYAVGSFPTKEIGRIDNIFLPNNEQSAAWHIAKWDGRNWNIVGNSVLNQFDPLTKMSRLNTIQVFDPDGPGSQPSVLVVGGVVNNSFPQPRSATLMFDGTTWTQMGQNLGGVSHQDDVRDLEIFNGELYACGRFNVSSGVTGIAKWDPNTQFWIDVGGGIPTALNFVRAERMAVGDAEGDGTDELYVSGTFTFSVTGGSAVKLAKWNGSNWSRVTGFTGTSTANQANLGGPTLLKFMNIGDGPALYVGDAIYTGSNARGAALARLKNGVWSTLLPQTPVASGNANSYVFAADMFAGPDGSQLHIGGTRLLNGVTGQPTGVSLARRSAAGVFGPLGTFPTTNNGLVAWMRPLDWDGAGPGGEKLLFGATQFRWGTIGTLSGFQPMGMALWNGTAIEMAHSGSDDLGLSVWMFKELDPDGAGPLPTTFYIGHNSDVVAGLPLSGLVAFDGVSYQSTPAGITRVVDAVAFTPAAGTTSLYAACQLINSNGPALVRLDGSSWTTVAQPPLDENEFQPPNIDALATAIIAGEPSIVVSGRFREIGGVQSRFVARFNGTSWVAMDAGLPAPTGDPSLFRVNDFSSLVVSFNGDLFIMVGYLIFDPATSTSTVFPARLYRWNGTSWDDIGPGENKLEVLDLGSGPGLYTVRNYQPSGDASYVAKWNGTTFDQVGPGFSWNLPAASRSNIMTVGAHDFGSGKRLIVTLDGPGISNAVAVSGLLLLDDGQWQQVLGGERFSQSRLVFSSTNPTWGGLYVGGAFNSVAGDNFNNNTIESQGIAWLKPSTTPCNTCPACPADYNQDGGVTGDDIAAFFADFENGADCADTNIDGGITGDDIAAFFTVFEAGGC